MPLLFRYRRVRLLFAVLAAGLVGTGPACSCDDPPRIDGGPGSAGDGDGDGSGDGDGDGDGGLVDGGLRPGPDGCFPGLTAIALTPADVQLSLDGSPPPAVTLSASGTFSSGPRPLPATALVWSAERSDDTPPGVVVDGVFTPDPRFGGVVVVRATDGCISGTAEVTLHLEVTHGTPAVPADWAGAPVAEGSIPEIVYPSDETRIPRNVFRTLFQWRSQGFDAFRLVFQGPYSTVTVYTDGVHADCLDKNPAAGCWEADDLTWGHLAASNAGSELTWSVDALDRSTDPPTVRRSSTARLGISARDVRGAIFYWSTTSKGIRRANISDAAPEDYLTGDPGTLYADDAVKCVACHTVSRDGLHLAAPVDAQSGKSVWVLDVTAQAPPWPQLTELPGTSGHVFTSFSADNGQVVIATKDRMFAVDATTGAELGDLDTEGLPATHPDWSPDDRFLVFSTGKGDAPGGASLALLPREGDGFGPPDVLVEPEGDRSLLFPMFSPDGAWVAYAEGKGGHGDDEMLLFLTSPDDPVPVELARANRVVGNALTDGQHQNAGPTWAPGGDLQWIAFNSKRPYGVVGQGGTQQIWIAAVDPAQLAAGGDPSYPAFRLPSQGLEENNHRAFWALDVRTDYPDGGVIEPPEDAGSPPPEPDAGAPCAVLGQACDPSGAGCCDPIAFCDTLDDGETYTCFTIGG